MPPPAGARPGDSIETLYVDIAARADQLVTNAEAAVQQVIAGMAKIDNAAVRTEKRFSKLGQIMKQALTIATGIQFANMTTQIIRSVVNLGKQLISTNAQMQMYERSFETLTGSAQEAGEIIEWVKEQAKLTPFDVPGLIAASQQLMTWGLDLKEWFTVVGDVAAGMNRPLSQVVNAVGTLATGQTGEAVRRFRDLGINLREFTDVLQFDARGALITPLEDAIPIVKQIMVDKFGGMMESQSKTWTGVISNLKDSWQQFVQVLGEPIFDTLNVQLAQLQLWVEDNSDNLESFAETLGNALGSTLDIMLKLVSAIGDFIMKTETLLGLVEGVPGFWEETKSEAAGIVASVQATRDWFVDQVTGKTHWTSIGGAIADWEAKFQAYQGILLETWAAEDDVKEVVLELTDAQKLAAQAVRDLGGEYADLTDEQVIFQAGLGNIAKGVKGMSDRVVDLIPGLSGLTDVIVNNTAGMTLLAEVYNRVITNQRILAEEAERSAQAMADQQAQLEAEMALADKIAPGLTDTLNDALEALGEGMQAAATASAEALEEIQTSAYAAEQAALALHQEAMAKLKEDHAREQLRRQQQFNVRWARMLREQNDENLDAEWEYQYRKEQLLIEGDEIALADLEARYAHEKDVRARDQGQARTDVQEDYQSQLAEAERSFQDRLDAQEAALREEIDKIRTHAQEAAQVQIDKDAETREAQEKKAQELYERLGEMLYDQSEGNKTTAQLILESWAEMYDGIEVDAIWTSFIVRGQMMDLLNTVMTARMELAALRLEAQFTLPQPGEDPNQPRYAIGGYTPNRPRAVFTDPGEWIATAGTTRALESALGKGLTQERVQRMAINSRRTLDVNVRAAGLPAGMIDQIRRALVESLTKESGVY